MFLLAYIAQLSSRLCMLSDLDLFTLSLPVLLGTDVVGDDNLSWCITNFSRKLKSFCNDKYFEITCFKFFRIMAMSLELLVIRCGVFIC